MNTTGFVSTIGRAVRRWWIGDYVPPENDPSSPLVFVMSTQRRHWTARATEATWRYFVSHHRWIIGTLLIGLVGLYIAATRGP